MKSYNLFWLVFIAIFFSCNLEKEEDIEEIIFNNENDLEIKEKKFVILESTDESLIGDIDQLEIYRDKIYILDAFINKRLYVFDLDGKYITHIGDVGQGPNEYVFPISFNINPHNNTITIFDLQQDLILIYDIENYNCIKKQRRLPSVNDVVHLPDNYYVYFDISDVEYRKNKSKHFIITDSSMNILDEFVNIEFNSGHNTTPFKGFYRHDKEYFGYIRYRGEIYQVSSQEVKPIYKLVFNDFEFPSVEYLNHETKIAYNENFLHALKSSKYIFYHIIFGFDNFITVSYVVKDKSYIGIYNKMNKKTYNYSLSRFEEVFNLPSDIIFRGTSNKQLVAEINPLNFKKYIDQTIINEEKENKLGENAVLMLLEFK